VRKAEPNAALAEPIQQDRDSDDERRRPRKRTPRIDSLATLRPSIFDPPNWWDDPVNG
jgi:hypothetical protein